MTSFFSSSCVLKSDNYKQSITVWLFTINILLSKHFVLKLGRAYTNGKIALQRQTVDKLYQALKHISKTIIV